ncbi:MAG TPA: hypothetical protein VNA30_00265 [Mycobacteriales bacterium]|nr:hypothetical protein [Mycobacteriales bacterium]
MRISAAQRVVVALTAAVTAGLLVAPAQTSSRSTTAGPGDTDAALAGLCPPGWSPHPGGGLDGGLGCDNPSEAEDPTVEGHASRQSSAGKARATGSGRDALTVHEQAVALRNRAEAARAALGTRDFVAGGKTVVDSGAVWKEIGPKPLHFDDPKYPGGAFGIGAASGRGSAIVIDRRDATGSTVVYGTAGGGVWRTVDAGATWTDLSAGLPSLAIGGIALLGNRIVVGTGEANTGTDNYAGLGTYYSDDIGRTWKRSAGSPADTVTSRVEASGDRVFLGTNYGLWRSTDRGTTFAKVPLPTGEGGKEGTADYQNWVSDVRVRPGVPDEVTVAVGWRSGGVPGAGLYRSTDGGATFAKMAAIGFGATSESADKIGRTSITYQTGPGQSNAVMWAVIQEPGKMNNENNPLAVNVSAAVPGVPPKIPFTTLNGVYKSIDNGATWALMANYENLVVAPGSSYTPTFTAQQAGPGAIAWYSQWIAVDPTDAGRVLLGLEELFESVGAGGASAPAWKVVGRYSNACLQAPCPVFPAGTTIHPDQHEADLIALPGGGTRAYIANDGGPYRQDTSPTKDYTSEGWIALSKTLSTTQPHEAVMGRDGTVYLGMQDNGTAKITPEGYAVSILGGDGFHVAVDPNDSDIAYGEVQNGSIRRTTNGGTSALTTITPTGSTRAQFSTPFEMDPKNGEHLVFGSGQIWQTDKASTVTSAGWVNVFDLGAPNAANAIDVNGDAVYAAFCGECNALPLLGKGGVLDPSIFTGGIATNVTPGCVREVGSKECWHVAKAEGLPKRFVGGIAIDPADPKTLYVAVSSYRRRFAYEPDQRGKGIVFVSKDAGETFRNISGDLPDTFGADVKVVGDRLVLATDTGVYATPAATPGAWVPFGTGLPAVPAYELQLNPQGTILVLATHGRGVWTLPLDAAAPPAGPPAPPKRPNAPPGKGPMIPATGLPLWPLIAPLFLGAGMWLRRRRSRP